MKKANTMEILRDILDLVGIESVNGNVEGILKAQECVRKIAERLGLKTKIAGNGKVMLVALDFLSKKDFGFVCHIDTVPYDAREWKYSPLGEISNEWLYGRGVIDDKGATVQAMHAIAETNAKNILLIVGSSEEGEWTDMQEFIAENPELPEALATLDGNGVQNGCRGYADIEICFENADLIAISTPEGANNTVPAKATAKANNGTEIHSNGVAAHSSIPEQGDNALIKLVLGYPQFFTEDLIFLMKTCEERDLARFGLSLDSSMTPTTAELKDGRIFINLNVRIGTTMTKKQVEKFISRLSHVFDDMTVKEIIYPSSIPADSKYIMYMLEAYENILGKATLPKIAKGVGYNAALPNCCIFGPEWDENHELRPDLCHCADEGRPIEELMQFYEMLLKFIEYLN